MGTSSFPGVKSGQGVKLTPHHPSSAVGHRRVELYLYSLWTVRPVHSLSACTWVNLFYPYFIKQRDIRLLYRFPCVRSFYLTGAVFPLALFPVISMSALDVLSPPCMSVVFVIRTGVCFFSRTGSGTVYLLSPDCRWCALRIELSTVGTTQWPSPRQSTPHRNGRH
jgi:hypothetical protein